MQNIKIETIQSVDKKAMESIIKFRTNITFLDVKILNIISVTGREGKSTVSFLLSRSLSEIGKKVILIDANIRENSTNKFYKLNNLNMLGLSDYLMDKAKLENTIYQSNYKNLDMVISGKVVGNPADILSNTKMKDLINFCRNSYDYVIIDTPAAGEVADASIIAPFTDGSILIIEPGMTDFKLAINVKEQCEINGTKLLGVVLNKI